MPSEIDNNVLRASFSMDTFRILYGQKERSVQSRGMDAERLLASRWNSIVWLIPLLRMTSLQINASEQHASNSAEIR